MLEKQFLFHSTTLWWVAFGKIYNYGIKKNEHFLLERNLSEHDKINSFS